MARPRGAPRCRRRTDKGTAGLGCVGRYDPAMVRRDDPTTTVRITAAPEVMVRDDDARLAVIVPITPADPRVALPVRGRALPAQWGWRIRTTQSALQVAGLGPKDITKALDWVKRRIEDTNRLRQEIAEAADEARVNAADWWTAQQRD
jgi:hypothetical protein